MEDRYIVGKVEGIQKQPKLFKPSDIRYFTSSFSYPFPSLYLYLNANNGAFVNKIEIYNENNELIWSVTSKSTNFSGNYTTFSPSDNPIEREVKISSIKHKLCATNFQDSDFGLSLAIPEYLGSIWALTPITIDTTLHNFLDDIDKTNIYYPNNPSLIIKENKIYLFGGYEKNLNDNKTKKVMEIDLENKVINSYTLSTKRQGYQAIMTYNTLYGQNCKFNNEYYMLCETSSNRSNNYKVLIAFNLETMSVREIKEYSKDTYFTIMSNVIIINNKFTYIGNDKTLYLIDITTGEIETHVINDLYSNFRYFLFKSKEENMIVLLPAPYSANTNYYTLKLNIETFELTTTTKKSYIDEYYYNHLRTDKGVFLSGSSGRRILKYNEDEELIYHSMAKAPENSNAQTVILYNNELYACRIIFNSASVTYFNGYKITYPTDVHLIED